jgi:hypothetical protein
LLAAARGFAVNAAPLSAEFIKHEMPPDFLADLDDKIAGLEEAIGHQSDGIGERIAAAASIEEQLEKGLSVIRKLDTAIRNKYTDDPAVLAEWTSASHTERGPRRQLTATPPPPATPPAPPAP